VRFQSVDPSTCLRLGRAALEVTELTSGRTTGVGDPCEHKVLRGIEAGHG
jgi:hypothetical protein